jgi:hypothetical protein
MYFCANFQPRGGDVTALMGPLMVKVLYGLECFERYNTTKVHCHVNRAQKSLTGEGFESKCFLDAELLFLLSRSMIRRKGPSRRPLIGIHYFDARNAHLLPPLPGGGVITLSEPCTLLKHKRYHHWGNLRHKALQHRPAACI